MLLSSGVLIWFDSSAYPNYLVMKFHFFTFKEKKFEEDDFYYKDEVLCLCGVSGRSCHAVVLSFVSNLLEA